MYLERYLNGEYENVWNELMVLGPEVRNPSIYPDAWAVAQETMHRVRWNVEELIPQLLRAGFLFGYDHRLAFELSFRKSISDNTAHDFSSVDTRYLNTYAMAKEFAPVFIPAEYVQRKNQEYNDFWSEYDDDFIPDADKDYEPFVPNILRYLQQINTEIGTFSLSVQACYELVGGVNFYGYHPGWVEWYNNHIEHHTINGLALMELCDPLYIHPLTADWKKRSWDRTVNGITRGGFEFAVDRALKNITSGSGGIFFSMPDTAADTLIMNGYSNRSDGCITFVDYLRLCFKWAGFPGMSTWKIPPEELVAPLTKTLLPF